MYVRRTYYKNYAYKIDFFYGFTTRSHELLVSKRKKYFFNLILLFFVCKSNFFFKTRYLYFESVGSKTLYTKLNRYIFHLYIQIIYKVKIQKKKKNKTFLKFHSEPLDRIKIISKIEMNIIIWQYLSANTFYLRVIIIIRTKFTLKKTISISIKKKKTRSSIFSARRLLYNNTWSETYFVAWK